MSVTRYVPCDARMLANTRTAGSWEAWTGRGAITEGMSPFLRPEVMAGILPILVGANDFFKDPQAHQDYLADQRVQHLACPAPPGIWFGWGGTGRNPQPDDAAKISAARRDPLPPSSTVTNAWPSSPSAGEPAVPAGGLPSRCPV